MRVFMIAALLLAAHGALPAKAEPGDKPGWSVGTDPRKRAFLHYVAKADGERLVTFACLRDVDDFSIYANVLPETVPQGDARLSLASGKARFEIDGAVGSSGGQKSFEGGTDLDAAARKRLSAELTPVLQGKQPIEIAVGGVGVVTATAPVPAAALATFRRICFGR